MHYQIVDVSRHSLIYLENIHLICLCKVRQNDNAGKKNFIKKDTEYKIYKFVTMCFSFSAV